MTEITPEMQRIIEVANELQTHGDTSGSTGEHIAAAFVLNDMSKLPGAWTHILNAWDRLGPQWQGYVRTIQAEISPEQLKQQRREL